MTPSEPVAPSRLALYLDLIRWSRPAGWLLLLWPSLGALWLAAGGFPGWHLLAVFTLGTLLMRSAGCCINDVADRAFDRHVRRTAGRPVTRGALSVRQALACGTLLALAAFALVLTTNAPTIAWSFVALAVTLAYPYAKRFIAMPQAVLGVAFSLGIPMAFTAAGGSTATVGAMLAGVPALAGWLVLGNLCWVLAYDTEYAMVDREDDLRIGIRTSAITLGRFDLPAIGVCYLIYVSIWAFAQVQPGRIAIALIAFGIALAQLAWHGWLIRGRTREGCLRAFHINHWLGFTMFAAIVARLAWAPA